jgi:hypothetical protein
MKPRQIVLIVILIAVAIFDYMRMHKRHEAQQQAYVATAVSHSNAAPDAATTPAAQAAWSAYDHAASLRDANATQFQPALDAFHADAAQVPATSGSYAAQDLETCRMWLVQYRANGSMHAMAAHHIDSCSQLHRDVAQ